MKENYLIITKDKWVGSLMVRQAAVNRRNLFPMQVRVLSVPPKESGYELSDHNP